MSTYGLPRVVIQFLIHMQQHRDGLKWNITDGHHKITLTLTWTFRKNKSSKETLWERIQRTLRLQRSDSDANGIPPELTKFLDSSPKRPLVMSPVKKSPSWSRAYRQHSLHSPPGGGSGGAGGGGGGGSNGLGRIRFSWPGASSPIAIRPPVQRQTSTPLPVGYHRHGSPNLLTRSDSSASAPSRVRLSFRTEEDIERSLEDLMERTRVQTQEKLNAIREEWNRSMAECSSWPRRTQSADAPQVRRSLSTLTTPRSSIELLDGTSDTASTSTAAAASSSMMGGVLDARSCVAAVSGVMPTPISRSASAENPSAAAMAAAAAVTGAAGTGPGANHKDIKGVNDTVQKCLSSCDKILYRHSTTIT